MKTKVQRNIRSNNYDIYEGFVDIVVDTKDPQSKRALSMGQGRSKPNLKAIILP